jgi:hypothetical protein
VSTAVVVTASPDADALVVDDVFADLEPPHATSNSS